MGRRHDNQLGKRGMLDFDSIDDWAPDLGRTLRDVVPAATRQSIAARKSEFIEGARDVLLSKVDRQTLVAAVLGWIRGAGVRAYHGTRLTESEIESIRDHGLRPLVAEQRRQRLERALSPHPQWPSVQGRLQAALEAYGGVGKSGDREGQVHLTLSRAGLTKGFSHYLTHGSEFDQHVAHDLLGASGVALLAQDGKPVVVAVDVPGPIALEGAHRHLSVEQMISRGDLPNLVREFLGDWAFRLAVPTHQSSARKLDCGIWFRDAVPADWIASVEMQRSA